MPPSETRDLRQEILVAAERLFNEHGYHGLSMREIAEAVGVSKAALYYHFRDKEELFLAVLVSYLEQVEAMIDRVRAENQSARTRITRLVENILSQPVEQRAVIRLASQEMEQLGPAVTQTFQRVYHQKFIDKIESILREGIASGELRPLDPGVATWTLLGIMYPYFYPAHTREMPQPEDVMEQVISIYLSGVEK